MNYCYSHEYWMNYNNLRQMSRNFLKTIDIDDEFYENWTLNQIQWIEKKYEYLFRMIRKRKQNLTSISESQSNDEDNISDNDEDND